MRPNDIIPVMLLAASDYPDVAFRDHLKASIEAWIFTLEPRHSHAEVMELLGLCRGSVLEPFTLSDSEVDTAALLARIAFSRAFDQSRFRVVSNQTLGDRGGCVLTNNLRHFYAERFALGNRPRIGKDYWCLVPRGRPKSFGTQTDSMATGSGGFARVSAKAELGSDGYRISISVPNFAALRWPDSWRLESMLGQNSRLHASDESLANLNIRVSVTSHGMHLSPASPEATMRLTAQMLANRLLAVNPGPGIEGASSIHVRLSLPRENEDVMLKALVSLGPGYFADWIRMEIEEGPRLSIGDKLRIAEWIGPPSDWVDEEMLETI